MNIFKFISSITILPSTREKNGELISAIKPMQNKLFP